MPCEWTSLDRPDGRSGDRHPQAVQQVLSGKTVRTQARTEGVSTDSLKFHPAPPCPTLIRRQAAYGRLLPP
jgi:hypothetical protein